MNHAGFGRDFCLSGRGESACTEWLINESGGIERMKNESFKGIGLIPAIRERILFLSKRDSRIFRIFGLEDRMKWN
ncbi:hypothetical protein [Burkholderia cepacia]|uniref:hypothetical protein n=1 Tax=Burkholderia cepacia TaxID=292 RepID=UPI001CF3B854|nr:hypothetical protein [Burkholderia cepacia]MCA8351801.1 hypothetical protein [Burkholderia cepacia]